MMVLWVCDCSWLVSNEVSMMQSNQMNFAMKWVIILMNMQQVCVCVCVWERERERERSGMNFTEVGSFDVVAILFWWIEGLKKVVTTTQSSHFCGICERWL